MLHRKIGQPHLFHLCHREQSGSLVAQKSNHGLHETVYAYLEKVDLRPTPSFVWEGVIELW